MLQSYLEEIRRNRGSGAATDETSFYTPLENLLDAVGEDLEPPIDCVMQLKDAGAGNPDGGLFRMDQIPETRAPLFDDGGDIPKPERGAIEVKAPAEGLDDLQESDQVEKYLEEYGICLITNYRAFRLLGADGPTGPDVLEDFELAESEGAFWELTHQAGSIPSGLEERFEGFLKRVLTRNAPLLYKRLPYFNGRRPEIVGSGGSGSSGSSSRGSGSEVIRIETGEGTAVDFDSTEEYLRFQEKRERQHPPS
jgi:hypothetical protein